MGLSFRDFRGRGVGGEAAVSGTADSSYDAIGVVAWQGIFVDGDLN